MSRNDLKRKAAALDFSSLPGVAPAAPSPVVPTEGDSGAQKRPKTAPGLLMSQANDQRSELLRENETLRATVDDLRQIESRAAELRDELQAWEGAKATRLIDPTKIRRSRWANRDARHFESEDFRLLKEEIASAGGNVQPVKVRPVAVPGDDGAEYEIVYGHRRFQACLELGLPVLAMVDSVDDRGLFVEMDRENRTRKDLSAWEQGLMYRRALDEGLFPSNRRLAEAVGADLGNVGKALALASLPQEIVEAFASPLDLQYRFAKPLKDAFERDPVIVRSRAQRLSKMTPKLPAKEVIDRLIAPAGAEAEEGCTVQPPAPVAVEVAGKKVASVSLNAKRGGSISIEPGLLTEDALPELAELLEKFLVRQAKRTANTAR
jgi:ParB family chromosome partitioning protein